MAAAMTADDLMATFNIFRLRGDAVWANMTGIEKVDDNTVKFHMDSPSSLAERIILTTNLRPASVFGDIADRAAMMSPGDDGWDALLQELTEFRPESPVSGGPYTILPDTITEASLMLELNPGGFAGDIQNYRHGAYVEWRDRGGYAAGGQCRSCITSHMASRPQPKKTSPTAASTSCVRA